MIKHWLSYLLIALIVCQSVLAVADNHETQTQLSKIEFDNNYDQTGSVQNELADEDSTHVINTDHCDHCGFCHHGQVVHSLLSLSSLPNSPLLKIQYNDAAPNASVTFLYRPPKA